MEGERAPVVRARKFKDEKNALVPTYRPGVRSLPLSCRGGVSLLTLTFQMDVGYLIPGPLPVVD